MLRPSGLSASTVTLAPSRLKISGRDAVGGAVGAVQQHVEPVEIELVEARVQLAQVVLAGAVQLAHVTESPAARSGSRPASSAASIASSASSESL